MRKAKKTKTKPRTKTEFTVHFEPELTCDWCRKQDKRVQPMQMGLRHGCWHPECFGPARAYDKIRAVEVRENLR